MSLPSVMWEIEPEVEPEVDVPPDATPLEFLQAIYRDPTKPLSVRMRAGIACLPFRHPKFEVVANVNMNIGEELEQAIQRSGKSLTIGPARVIEGSVVDE